MIFFLHYKFADDVNGANAGGWALDFSSLARMRLAVVNGPLSYIPKIIYPMSWNRCSLGWGKWMFAPLIKLKYAPKAFSGSSKIYFVVTTLTIRRVSQLTDQINARLLRISRRRLQSPFEILYSWSSLK